MAASRAWRLAFRVVSTLGAGAVLALVALPSQSLSVLAANNFATTSDQAITYQINTSHDGSIAHSTLTPPLSLGWSTNLGASVSYPLVANGHVFVTTGSSSTGTNLYALNLSSGAIAWGPKSLGGTYWNASAAYEGGRVFTVNGSGAMQAFDENTGATLWSVQLPGQYSFSSPPTAFNGVIYVGGAGSGGTLYAVRESDGAVLWTGSVMNGDDSSPAVSPTGVYVSYACAQSYDFNPNIGTLNWHHSTSCEGGGGKTPVLAGGRLYVRDAVLGNVVLDAASGNPTGSFTANRAPAISGTHGYFLNGTTLTAIDLSSNTTLWTFSGDSALSSAPIVVNGFIYVGSTNGNLYALDQNGVQVWTTNVGSPINAPDEQNVSQPITGLGAGYGYLVVPASNTVNLYGAAEALYPGDAIWGNQQVGQAATPAAPFTLIDNSLSSLQVSSIGISGDFTQTNTCPASLAPGASCVISVSFMPSAAGLRTGTLTVIDNAPGSPHTIALSGTGTPVPAARLTITPANAAIAAGGNQSYQAEAFDSNGNDLGDVTSSTAFSLDGTACSANKCASTVAGSHTVTGQYQSASGTASLTVTAGPLDHIALAPATATVTAGSGQAYTTEAFDRYGNDLGADSAATLSIAPDGSCQNRTCVPAQAGSHTVTATDGTITATASVNATAGPIARLSVTPAYDTVSAGTYQAYQAEAYDSAGDDLGNATGAVSWSIDNPGITGCSGNSCSSTLAGSRTVTATYQQISATATLIVNPGPAVRVRLSPGSATITAGSAQSFDAQTYDGYNNAVSDVTASTSLTISPSGSCSANTCTATQAAYSYTVTGTYSGMTDNAYLTVNAGAFDHLSMSPSSASIAAGKYQPFSVFAVDKYENPAGDASSATWAITPDGSCQLGSGSASCTATVAGQHSVTASALGKSVTASLTVTPGAVTRIRIAPVISSMAAGSSQAFTARTVDGYENTVADVTAATTFSISPSGSCSANVCTAGTQPTTNANITGNYNGMTDLIDLAIIPGPVDHLTLSPVNTSITAGQSQSYAASAYDQYGNLIGDVTTSASFSIAPDGSCSGASCTATTAGAHNVTATYEAKTGSATLSVVAGPATSISVTPANLTLIVGQSAKLTAVLRDAYGNVAGGASSVSWSLSSAKLGTLSPTTGSTTTFTASANMSSTGKVTATIGTLTATVSVAVLPATPSKVTAASPGGHKVNLTWESSAGASTYSVYRSSGSSGWVLVKSGIGGASYTDNNLVAGQTYNYYVVAVGATGLQSAPSNTASVIVKG